MKLKCKRLKGISIEGLEIEITCASLPAIACILHAKVNIRDSQISKNVFKHCLYFHNRAI